jgi:hypothetical protein
MLVAHPPGARQLVAVEGLDPPGRLHESGVERGGDRRRRPLGLGDPELIGAEIHPIEALGEVEERAVAPPAHLVDNRRDTGDGARIRRRGRPGKGGHDAVG